VVSETFRGLRKSSKFKKKICYFVKNVESTVLNLYRQKFKSKLNWINLIECQSSPLFKPKYFNLSDSEHSTVKERCKGFWS